MQPSRGSRPQWSHPCVRPWIIYITFATISTKKNNDWSNSNADRVGEAVRRHWREICRQWQTVGVLYQTHHGTCVVPSRTAPSAPRSSPDLHYRTFVIIILILSSSFAGSSTSWMARCLFSQWKNNIYGDRWRTTIRQWDNEICTYNTDDDLDHIYTCITWQH